MAVEWQSPAIILSAGASGEGDALASVFTEAHGIYKGLVRGGLSRARAGTWQAGNLVEARWMARLPDQLGTLSAELLSPAAALAMHDPLAQAVLAAACAVAEGALPEREAHGRVFRGLLHVIAHLQGGFRSAGELAVWELGLLADLGYGLDLSCCAVSGAAGDLTYVSPRTGRAVSAAGAGVWASRLLPLPAFLRAGGVSDELEPVAQALRLTLHFLARDAFGARHRPVPTARRLLMDRLSA